MTYCTKRSEILFIIVACCSCGRENEPIDLSNLIGVEVGKTIDSSTTEVAITEGVLAGAKVSFSAGTVAVGAIIQISEASQPTTFSALNTVAASAPIAIGATDAAGSAITQASSALAINLPLSSATSLLDRSSDKLCALLDPVGDADPIVWRRSSMTISSSSAAIFSSYFGVFQLVYCGEDNLSGFKESTDVSGTTESKFEIDNIVGTWIQNCAADVGDNDDYVYRELYLEAGGGKRVDYYYDDSECKTLVNTFLFDFSHKIGERSANFYNTYDLDYTHSSIYLSYAGSSYAGWANQQALYGYNDWEAGVMKDLSGRSGPWDLPSLNSTYYSILQFDNNKLYGGKDSSENEAMRSTALETLPWIKKVEANLLK